MTKQMLRVAVVGAGPAGMTAALRLQQAGARVVVFESEPWIGGRTRTDRHDGFVIDAGAQLFGSMFTNFLDVTREIGLGDRLLPSAGRDALWRDGRAHEVVYGSIPSMVTSSALSWRTKLRLGTTYVPFLHHHAASLDVHAPERAAAAGLDRESIAAWGTRTLDDEFVERLVYPQLSAYYGALPEETSAGLYHALAHQAVDLDLFALDGGAAVLCETIAARLDHGGGEVRLARPVRSVAVRAGGVTIGTEAGEEEFDAVVVAVPAPVAAGLIEGVPSLTQWLARVRFRPALTVGLMLDSPLDARYFGLSFGRASASALVAACVQENKAPGLVPRGKGLLVAFIRPDRAPELVDAEPRRIVDAVLTDLRVPYPGIDRRVQHARIYRWRVGNPIFHPGYLATLATARDDHIGSDPRVAVAGDYLYVSSIEGAVTSGLRAAERIVEWLPPPT